MRKISLTGKYAKGQFAIIDDEDFDRVSKFSWSAATNGYAYRRQWVIRGKYKRTIYLHWEVLLRTPLPGFVTDHLNRNKLDNRKKNLRFCSQSENTINSSMRSDNTSGIRGVRLNGGYWVAEIGKNKKMVFLGKFKKFSDAISRRKIAEKEFGYKKICA